MWTSPAAAASFSAAPALEAEALRPQRRVGAQSDDLDVERRTSGAVAHDQLVPVLRYTATPLAWLDRLVTGLSLLATAEQNKYTFVQQLEVRDVCCQ